MPYDFTDEELDKLNEQYQQFCDENQNLSCEDFAEKINSLPVRQDKKNYFRQSFCGEFLDYYCARWIRYSKRLSAYDKDKRKLFCDTVKNLPQDNYWYWSVCHFFNGDYKSCERCPDEVFQNFDGVHDEFLFVTGFLQDFKNAYPGFWKNMAARFKKIDCTEAEDLSNLFEAYYSAETDEQREEILLNHIHAYPNQILPKEFLGFLYEDMKLWYNAIQILEQVKDSTVFWFDSDIYFQLGWLYDEVKELATAKKIIAWIFCAKTSTEIFTSSS